MTNSASHGWIKAEVLTIASRIPAGWVTTYSAIGRHIQVQPRHVAYILAALDDLERETVPWWRVVADGGAVGRHKRRDEQVARLKQDDVPLSAASVVQELSDRRIADLTKPPQQPFSAPRSEGALSPARSRGMKSH